MPSYTTRFNFLVHLSPEGSVDVPFRPIQQKLLLSTMSTCRGKGQRICGKNGWKIEGFGEVPLKWIHKKFVIPSPWLWLWLRLRLLDIAVVFAVHSFRSQLPRRMFGSRRPNRRCQQCQVNRVCLDIVCPPRKHGFRSSYSRNISKFFVEIKGAYGGTNGPHGFVLQVQRKAGEGVCWTFSCQVSGGSEESFPHLWLVIWPHGMRYAIRIYCSWMWAAGFLDIWMNTMEQWHNIVRCLHLRSQKTFILHIENGMITLDLDYNTKACKTWPSSNLLMHTSTDFFEPPNCDFPPKIGGEIEISWLCHLQTWWEMKARNRHVESPGWRAPYFDVSPGPGQTAEVGADCWCPLRLKGFSPSTDRCQEVPPKQIQTLEAGDVYNLYNDTFFNWTSMGLEQMEITWLKLGIMETSQSHIFVAVASIALVTRCI